jgi:ribosome-associated protein
LGVPARPQVRIVVDRTEKRGEATKGLKVSTMTRYVRKQSGGKAIRRPARKKRKEALPSQRVAVARKSPTAGTRPSPEEVLKTVLARLDDQKATETTRIDLKGKTTLADYMVVTCGRSHRHVGAIAENIVEALEKRGVSGVRVEGLPHCDWVLIDASDVIVHVFRPEVREFYNLEKMWARARPAKS